MLISNLELLTTASGGVARLRELILTLAVQGKLVSHDPTDEPAGELLKKVRLEKDRLIAEGRIKRDKPQAEISEEEQPFDLPHGWVWARIADVAFPQAGFAFKSNGFNELRQGLPLIRIRDVGDSDPSTFFSGDYREEFIVQRGDWLISMDGEFRVREWVGPKALLNQRVTRLMFYGKDLFQLFVISALQFKLNELQGTKAYTTVDHLSGGQIASSVIALPPLAEQLRIVTRVEELMRLCDALEAKGQLEATQHAQLVSTLLGTLTESETPEELAENWRRVATHFDLLLDRPEAVDALEQAILQLAVRGLLTSQSAADMPVEVGDRENPVSELPLSWAQVSFDDILLELRYGTSVKCSYEKVGAPVLRIPNLKGGRVDVADLKFGVLDEQERAKLELETGDILIVRSNGSASLVGSAALVGTESEGFAFAGYLVRARLRREYVEPAYLVLAMQTLEVRAQIEAPIRTTSGVKNINSTEISRLTFALPPLAEQSRIVTRVAQLRRLCNDLRQRLKSARDRQSQLAQALVEQQSTATV